MFTAECSEHVAVLVVDAGSLREGGVLPSGESFLLVGNARGLNLLSALARNGDDPGSSLLRNTRTVPQKRSLAVEMSQRVDAGSLERSASCRKVVGRSGDSA